MFQSQCLQYLPYRYIPSCCQKGTMYVCMYFTYLCAYVYAERKACVHIPHLEMTRDPSLLHSNVDRCLHGSLPFFYTPMLFFVFMEAMISVQGTSGTYCGCKPVMRTVETLRPVCCLPSKQAGDGNHNSVVGTVGLEKHVNPLAPSRYSQASPGIRRRSIGRILSLSSSIVLHGHGNNVPIWRWRNVGRISHEESQF
jgi:hypothetical protein